MLRKDICIFQPSFQLDAKIELSGNSALISFCWSLELCLPKAQSSDNNCNCDGAKQQQERLYSRLNPGGTSATALDEHPH